MWQPYKLIIKVSNDLFDWSSFEAGLNVIISCKKSLHYISSNIALRRSGVSGMKVSNSTIMCVNKETLGQLWDKMWRSFIIWVYRTPPPPPRPHRGRPLIIGSTRSPVAYPENLPQSVIFTDVCCDQVETGHILNHLSHPSSSDQLKCH